MKYKPFIIGLILWCTLLSMSVLYKYYWNDSSFQSPLVAKVGYASIYEKDLLDYVQNHVWDAQGDPYAHVDDVVINELLLQEAQRMDLHKNEQFMKTIEQYWRYQLVKQLVDAQQNKILKKIYVKSDELEELYERMKYSYDMRMLKFDSLQNIKEFKPQINAYLESKENGLKAPGLLEDRGWTRCSFKEIYQRFGLALKGGDKDRFVVIDQFSNHLWLVLLKDKQEETIRPFSEMKQELEEQIRSYKGTQMYLKWLSHIKNKTDIHLFKAS